MKYTGLCIKEALRLWPPAPNLQRTCTKDVESENFTIPRGVEIMVCNFIHLIIKLILFKHHFRQACMQVADIMNFLIIQKNLNQNALL
jgi:hypothetical protein